MVNRLQYLGPSTSKKVPASREYVDQVKATGITSEQANSTIDARVSTYADQAYVDTGDANRAALSYVDAQDLDRVPSQWKNIANGVVPLDATKQVPLANLGLIPAMNTDFQYGASGLPTSNKTLSSTSSTVALGAITIPAGNTIVSKVSWTMLVWGYFEVYHNNTGGLAYVDVRVNNPTTGPLIARGLGARGRKRWGPLNIMPLGPANVPKSAAAQTIYITGRFSGAGAVEFSTVDCGAMGLLLPGTGAW